MCGIAGVVSSDPAHLRAVAAMTQAIAHRGPDDEGYLVADSRSGRAASYSGPDTVAGITDPPLPGAIAGDVAFGNRRLAILDLTAAGHGPMPSADGRLWITYNGEVYNYLELRAELGALGHVFRSGTDTEVVLAAYAEWGRDCLRRFNGMFAFAIYDARERVVFCARDRFGVKPFHYAAAEGLFAFASEIKGVLAHPAVRRAPHLPTLHGFLVRGLLDEDDQSFFEGVKILPGSFHLTFHLASHRLVVERWYDLPLPADRPGDAQSLGALLQDAVKLRLRSDVDVGTCLSGGLDSSAIVALTARLRDTASTGVRRSFSIVYDDAGLDERTHVQTMIDAAGTDAALTTATSADLERDLPALVRHQDEPIPSPGPYSHWRVMALARQSGVKVLLDGQGADEILAGYLYQCGPYLAELARRLGPGRAWTEARALARVTGRPLTFFLGLMAYHAVPVPGAVRSRAVAGAATHGYLPPDMLDAALAAGRGGRHQRRTTLRSELVANVWRTSLPALLRYEDRNSMAFGIEARTPFLDYRLVEAALAVRAEDVIRDGWTKALLRDAVEGLVPDSIRLRRDKLGFPTPERRFLRELAPRVRQWLGPGARIRGLLRTRELDRWLAEGDIPLSERRGLWRLVAAEHWLRYVEGTHAP